MCKINWRKLSASENPKKVPLPRPKNRSHIFRISRCKMGFRFWILEKECPSRYVFMTLWILYSLLGTKATLLTLDLGGVTVWEYLRGSIKTRVDSQTALRRDNQGKTTKNTRIRAESRLFLTKLSS